MRRHRRKEWSRDAVGSALSIHPLTDEEFKREEDYACISVDCREQASHLATVKLRTYWRERLLCPYHAMKFAKRHKLEFIPRKPSCPY